ncbi:Peroxin-13 [Balamuthia mandrillaris]
MATTRNVSPPKPHELRKGTSSSSAQRMNEFERARASRDAAGAGGLTSSLSSVLPSTSGSASFSSSPSLPPRTGGYGSTYGTGSYGGGYGAGGYSSSYGSSYGGYGSSYGGYGSSYGGGMYGSRYGSRYGSSYGGGMYGSRYGSRYGGYGGYGSSYGGMYGSRYGGMRGGPMGADQQQMMGPNGGMVTWMDTLGRFVDTFGRFSELLDMNCEALYGSFSSVLHLFESFAQLRREFFFLFQTFTLFKLLQSFFSRVRGLSRRLLGLPPSSTTALDLKAFDNFQNNNLPSPHHPHAPKNSSTWPVFFLIVAALSGPVIINKLWKALTSVLLKKNNANTLEGAEAKMKEAEDAFGGGLMMVQAKADFQAQLPEDLPFRAGDVLKVHRTDGGDWWEAELNGRIGMIPSTFVEPCDSKPPLSSASSAAGRFEEVVEDLQFDQQQHLHPQRHSPSHASDDHVDDRMQPMKLHLGGGHHNSTAG